MLQLKRHWKYLSLALVQHRTLKIQSKSDIINKTALVTGCTSGIGLGIARGLAIHGCSVILNGFGNATEIDKIKEEFRHINSGTQVEVHHFDTDLSCTSDIKQMCHDINSIYPSGVDILVNNAGFQHVSPVETFPDSTWDKMLAVMLSAPFHLIKHWVPQMKERGWGRIINISSVHGLKASPNKSAYVACKHGILGLTKVIALETAGSGVTCNAICPGYADTPILQGQVKALAEKDNLTYEEAKVKFLSNFHASGEPVGIEQIADAVCFICSDAASQMTGSNVVLDGGWAAK